MKTHLAVLVLTGAVLSTAAVAWAQGLKPERITPEDMRNAKWTTSPSGTSQATVVGDPSKPGLYVSISKFPAGLKTIVHTHPDDRVVTVISGTAYFGFGETFDETGVQAMPAGTVYTEPANQPHYNWAKDGELVIQVVGFGPSGTTPFRPGK